MFRHIAKDMMDWNILEGFFECSDDDGCGEYNSGRVLFLFCTVVLVIVVVVDMVLL